MDPQLEGASNRRLSWLARVALLWALLIAARLAYIQIYCHDEYRRLARNQQFREMEVRALRGAITDRNGEPLAMSVPAQSVAINPMEIPNLDVAAELLSRVLGVEKEDLLQRMHLARASDRRFLWVRRKVPLEQARRLQAMNLEYVEFREESARYYPKGSLAAHILGGVDFEEKGNAGLELAMDEELESRSGTTMLAQDVRQRGYDSRVDSAAAAGRTITLTIDERLQYIGERELARAVRDRGCTTGTLMVLRVPTAEILAMASYPAFDPNQPLRPGESMEHRLNLAVAAPFEPGSVFKVITLAAALETTNLTPESVIPCGSGRINLFGRVIHDHNSYSALSFADVLAKSSNIGAIQIGLKVGDAGMFEYVRRFGLGRLAGLPLPAESAGKLRPLRHWTKSSIGSIAMGHEITTTSVQLAQACFVIANNGLLVKPRLVAKLQRPGELPEVPPQEPPQRVLKAETAITMRGLMERVVLPGGTGTKARMDGWSCGGKTGTAQIFDAKTGNYTKRYNSSFMGFAPAMNPAVVVVVTLNGSSEYGGAVAAPVFREVASAALRLSGVARDIPEGDVQLARSQASPESENDVALADLTTQEAEAPAQVHLASAAAELSLSQPEVFGPKMPNFRGKTMRAVLQECAAMGLKVDTQGSGVARSQTPAPGAVIGLGERITVQFAR